MIVADENVHRKIINEIRKIPIEVLSIQETFSGIVDEEVIAISKNPHKIIITEDKDFGEWVFAHNEKNISVILLRYHQSQLEEIISILISQLKQNINNFIGKFTTITPKKVRVHPIN